MISLSENAVSKIKNFSSEKPGKGLRSKVVGGGCSGLQYRMESTIPRNATRFSSATAHSLSSTRKSFLYLNGSELDYSEELMASGFKVVNPNAKRTCGCGESFVV